MPTPGRNGPRIVAPIMGAFPPSTYVATATAANALARACLEQNAGLGRETAQVGDPESTAVIDLRSRGRAIRTTRA
jgi:hypothetical protein